MAGFSKLATVALLATAGACFTTSAVIVYFLLRKNEEDVYEGLESIKSSRHTIIEVPVPADVIGGVIGRSGANVARIQESTNTKINFRDEAKGCTNRIAVIRGKPNDAQDAERLLRLAIAERLSITSEDILIPLKACGFVIGKHGDNVRMIREISKAKISLQDGIVSGELKKVTITGTHDEIQTAKSLIEEDVKKAMVSRKCGAPQLSTANRASQLHGGQLCAAPAPDHDGVRVEQKPRVEALVATAADGFLEVFISSIESPSRFWVGPGCTDKAVELDKLVDNMTDFYNDQSNVADFNVTEVNVSDVVAAPFSGDSKWYRAEVLSVDIDDYDASNSAVTIFYVDFGDQSTFKMSELRLLRDDFKWFPFQASECELANVRPSGSEATWSKEATALFDELTHCAQWKVIMMKTVRENPKGVKIVDLVDVSGVTDIDMAKELVARGFAELNQPSEV